MYIINAIDLRILPFYSPFCKGGYRGILIAFSKISPTPSLEKRGALVLKSMVLNMISSLKQTTPLPPPAGDNSRNVRNQNL
jgi:hypothetical protein